MHLTAFEMSAKIRRKSANYSPCDSMVTMNKNNQAKNHNYNLSRPTSRNSSNPHQDHATYRSHSDDIDAQLGPIDGVETGVKRIHRFGEDVDDDQPQNVYVCSCCWISRELEPAYEHLSSLSSLFFLFNFLVFAFGLACLGMGLWLRIDPKIYEIHKYIETQNFTYAGWIILFGGFASCLISIMGFVGTGKQSQCLLSFYIIILLTLLVGFIGSLVLLIVHGLGIKLELFLNKEIYEQMRRRAMSNQNDWAAQFLDFIQVKMRCCGAVDFTDYAKLGLVVPTTCYTIEKNYINAPGCGRAIRDLLDIRAGLAVGFLAGSIVSQLLCLILAMIIFCSIYQWRTNPQRNSTDMTRPMSPHKFRHQSPSPVPISTIGDALPHKWIDEEEPTSKRKQHYEMQRPRSRTPIIM